MTTVHSTIETGTSAEVDPGGAVRSATEGSEAVASEQQRKEILLLAQHIRERHPEVPLTTVIELVVQAHTDLEASRVQSFRMILTERAVRRQLARTMMPA